MVVLLTENCAALHAALESIDDSSVFDRYVVVMEPGVCSCSSNVPVVVPEGVTLRRSARCSGSRRRQGRQRRGGEQCAEQGETEAGEAGDLQ